MDKNKENESETINQNKPDLEKENNSNIKSEEINTDTDKTNEQTTKKKKKHIPKHLDSIPPELMEKFKQREEISNNFIEYFKNTLPFSEKEYEIFLKISKEPLPITFRLNKIYTYSESLELELTKIFLSNPDYNKRLKRHKLNFLDNIYSLDKYNKEIESDMKIKEILMRENDFGILRQELVAMIPVSLIEEEINEDSIILDMCASPGNKTIQILEIMEEKARLKNILPRGVIIANDFNSKRAGNMSHFFKNHFPINIVVLNYDASILPIIENDNYKPNIIICDVPCTGDGTLRKNKGLRRRWKIDYGLENHFIQYNILDNAIRQCKPGGKIVYSTCSINPIENEAVIASILEKYKNNIELVNCSNKLNNMGIKFREGLIKWKVCVKWDNENYDNNIWLSKFSEMTKYKNDLVKETMFHPIYTYENYQKKAHFNFSDPLNLRRCIRLYSQDNNSGSFFIAVIKKNDDFKIIEKKSSFSVPLNKEKMKTIGEDLDEFMNFIGYDMNDIESEKEKKIVNENQELKEKFFETEVKEEKKENLNEKNDEKDKNTKIIFTRFENITKFTESFNNLNSIFKFKNDRITKFLYSLRESSKKVFLFSEKLVEMIDIFNKMNLEIIRAGLVVFKREREEELKQKIKYRLTYYGSILLVDYLNNQVIELNNPKLLIDLLNTKDLRIKLKDIPNDIKEQIEKCEMGSIVLIYNGFILCSRKGKGTLHLMLPKANIKSIIKYVKEGIEEEN